MKKLFTTILFAGILAFGAIAQQGYRYSIVPGSDNTYSLAHKEIQAKAYAATIGLAPTMEETTVDIAQLTGALTLTVNVTPCYTNDRLLLLFKSDGTDRVVTFSTGFTSAGTFTVPASTYSTAYFVFNGSAWFEISRQNNVSGTVTTLLAGNGTVGAPSVSFTSDTDLGLYRIGANNLGVTAAGAKVLDVSATGLGVTGTTLTGAGTVSLPSFGFTAQTNLGLYKVSSSQVGFSSGGTLVGGFNSAGLFTSSITEQVAGLGITFAKQTIQLRTSTTYTATGSITVTAAELGVGLLTAATSTATTTFTLPTATEVATQIGATAGTTFDFVVSNAGASNGTVTVAVGSGIVASGFPSSNTLTLAGSATVGIATFRLTFISTTAATLTRTS